jgi:prepilin-type N-terminal cleavage/methylation domain-containing protein
MLKKKSRAFTLIEVLLTMALIGIVSSVATISLSQLQNNSYSSSLIDALISDIKTQQHFAMLQKKTSEESNFYGAYFKDDGYVLFEGVTFDPEKNTNYAVKFPKNIKITDIDLYQNLIVFESFSGELYNFDPEKNSVTISENTQISFSKLGVITLNNL